MLNMNRATLVGHAGRDPELRDLKKGGRAAVFTLATTEKWTDGEGRPAEATEWHRIVVYGAAVKAVEAMLRKGDRVMVEGRIATRGFTDREGADRTVTEIVRLGLAGHGQYPLRPPGAGRNPGCRRCRIGEAAGEGDREQDPGSGAGGGSAPESPA